MTTTDTVPKDSGRGADRRCRLNWGDGQRLGMIHPNKVTTLGFITTDVNISNECLNRSRDRRYFAT